MTLTHPDPLDRIVDHIIWRMEVAGWLDVDAAQREAFHTFLREVLRERGIEPF